MLASGIVRECTTDTLLAFLENTYERGSVVLDKYMAPLMSHTSSAGVSGINGGHPCYVASHSHGLSSTLPSMPYLPLLNQNPPPLSTVQRITPSLLYTRYVYSTHSLLYHLVLVAINAHFAVADNKGVNF